MTDATLSFPTAFTAVYGELKQVTSATVGCIEVEVCLTAVGSEWSPPSANVVDLQTVK